jgi:hypothetical protein
MGPPISSPGGLRDSALPVIERVRVQNPADDGAGSSRTHLVMYVVVNAFLIGIWAVTGAGFFWPVFVLGGWGIGLIGNAWDVYGRKPISEAEIAGEAERLRGR